MIPCLIGGGLNAYNLWSEHWEHWEHMAPLEERTEYPYQNIRVKNFPWGDGDKVCESNYAMCRRLKLICIWNRPSCEFDFPDYASFAEQQSLQS